MSSTNHHDIGFKTARAEQAKRGSFWVQAVFIPLWSRKTSVCVGIILGLVAAGCLWLTRAFLNTNEDANTIAVLADMVEVMRPVFLAAGSAICVAWFRAGHRAGQDLYWRASALSFLARVLITNLCAVLLLGLILAAPALVSTLLYNDALISWRGVAVLTLSGLSIAQWDLAARKLLPPHLAYGADFLLAGVALAAGLAGLAGLAVGMTGGAGLALSLAHPWLMPADTLWYFAVGIGVAHWLASLACLMFAHRSNPLWLNQ